MKTYMKAVLSLAGQSKRVLFVCMLIVLFVPARITLQRHQSLDSDSSIFSSSLTFQVAIADDAGDPGGEGATGPGPGEGDPGADPGTAATSDPGELNSDNDCYNYPPPSESGESEPSPSIDPPPPGTPSGCGPGTLNDTCSSDPEGNTSPPPETPQGISCSPSTQTGSVGGTITFTTSGGGGAQNWSASTANIKSGSGPSFQTTFPYAGTHDVTVTDGSQFAACSVNIGSTGTPDLTSGNLQIAGQLTGGTLLTFSGTVSNGGGSTAGVSQTEWQIDFGNNASVDETQAVPTQEVSPSGSQSASWQWTAVVGTHSWRICADIFNVVAESNEGNNCSPFVPFTILPALPTAMLWADPDTIDSGQSSLLKWSSTNMNPGSCTAQSGFGVGYNGTATSNNVGISTGALTSTQNYQIDCTGPGGGDSDGATVTVLQPEVTITADPPRVNTDPGGGGGVVKITIDAENVDTCAITRNGAAWKGPSPATGSPRTVLKTISDTVTSQTVYVASCSNNGGKTVTATQVVNVVSAFQEF